ncbi:MAG: hypothetical protein HZA92_10995 [Verrucomicrobia bacterium]|nr:hypothetical protein [Verrucomicrobiota bacterium]
MRYISRLAFTLAFATAFSVFTLDVSSAGKNAPKDTGLHGKIGALDTEAKTITVGGKTVTVDATTVITDSGKPAKLESLKIGMEATVSTFMLGEKLTAVNIKAGVVAASAPAVRKKK